MSSTDQIDAQPPSSKGETSSIVAGEDAFETLFSPERLRRTWGSLRSDLRYAIARDVIDWTDWALTIETSLKTMREVVISGNYVPSPATRIESGKGRGDFRVLAALNVRDALIYRHICDHALEIALPRKVAGAYYSRRHTRTPVGKTLGPSSDPSDRFYAIWLRYNQYRSKTLLNEPYEILVITDISNYFDSIQHDLLFEYLAPLGLPRKAVGLLGRLLEVFRPDCGHSPSPRVGIPVDELDCSRELAHIFLFEHDRRIAHEFGETNYVRWMDDQNVGVRNLTDARKVINAMSRSLSQQRLTLNAGKTTFLTPEDVAIHFQLDVNEALDDWWNRVEQSGWQMTEDLRQELHDLWLEVSRGRTAGKGNWDKVLKRFYGYATRADVQLLDGQALDDLVLYPHIAERIFLYFARRNQGVALLDLFANYSDSGENMFETTEHEFFESLLLLDASQIVAQRCASVAQAFAKGQYAHQTGRPLGRATAILCLYWFGESAGTIQNLYSEQDALALPKEVARARLACIGALTPNQISVPIEALFGHSSDDVLRLVRFLQALLSGRVEHLGNYKKQKLRWPLPGRFYDARAWLLLELASHGAHPSLTDKTRNDFKAFEKLIYTQQEQVIATRVAEHLGIGRTMNKNVKNTH